MSHELTDFRRRLCPPDCAMMYRAIISLKRSCARALRVSIDYSTKAGRKLAASFAGAGLARKRFGVGALLVVILTTLATVISEPSRSTHDGTVGSVGQILTLSKTPDRVPTLIVASTTYAEPSEAWPLLVEIAPPGWDIPDTVLQIRGLPPGATLTHGRPLSSGMWTVPIAALSNLEINVPAGVSEPSNLTLALVRADGTILAEARTVLSILEPIGAKTAVGERQPEQSKEKDGPRVATAGIATASSETSKAEPTRTEARPTIGAEEERAEAARKAAEAKKARRNARPLTQPRRPKRLDASPKPRRRRRSAGPRRRARRLKPRRRRRNARPLTQPRRPRRTDASPKPRRRRRSAGPRRRARRLKPRRRRRNARPLTQSGRPKRLDASPKPRQRRRSGPRRRARRLKPRRRRRNARPLTQPRRPKRLDASPKPRRRRRSGPRRRARRLKPRRRRRNDASPKPRRRRTSAGPRRRAKRLKPRRRRRNALAEAKARRSAGRGGAQGR